MADAKLSALVELAATPAVDDEVYIRDVSEASADESKRITMANLLAGAGGASLTVAEVEVFNGTSPTSWTDLDLSAVVGSNPAMVLLKTFKNTQKSVAFRKNGDADEYYSPGNFSVACLDPVGDVFGVMLVTTDNNGVVEWITETASTYTVDVMAYIK